jgi:hypothetical protein
MSRTRNDRDDRLHSLLRRGDPAVGEGLTTDEIQSLRRAVLNAAPEPRRRSLLLPVLVATCAVVLALSLWWMRGSEPIAEPPREASVAPPAVSPVLPPPSVPVVAITASDEPPVVTVEAHRRLEVAVAASAPSRRGDEIGPVEPHARQIQFSTPGGTRVVWVLTTEDVL